MKQGSGHGTSRSPQEIDDRNPIDVHLGVRIHHLRKASCMSKAGLAKLLGMSARKLASREQGTARFSAAQLYEVTRIFDVTLTMLFEDVPIKPHKEVQAIAPN